MPARKRQVKPGALGDGTRVEVRDLFYATPARLKFLKSDRSEGEAIRDVVRRLAMSRPDIAFTLAGEERAPVSGRRHCPARPDISRASPTFSAPSSAPTRSRCAADAKGSRSRALRHLPTLTRANSLGQYLFVNGRPVRDKLLIGVVRAAYADYLPRDRHPIVALFVTVDPHEVDVNVHPAKAEVRFRDPGLVRSLLIRALQEALARDGQRAATTGGSATIAALRPAAMPWRGTSGGTGGAWDWRRSPSRPTDAQGFAMPVRGGAMSGLAEAAQAAFDVGHPAADARVEVGEPAPELLDQPLGAARAQVHETYIVAQTRDGIVIVDQHAAHERIVYERLKAALARAGIARQILLIPEIVELDEADVERLVARADELARYGLAIEPFGPGAVAVRETPSLLGEIDARHWCAISSEHMAEWDESASARAPPDACRRHHGLPRLGARGPPPQARRNECAAARNGGDPQFRPMQSRPADLRRIEARRHRAPVRTALVRWI